MFPIKKLKSSITWGHFFLILLCYVHNGSAATVTAFQECGTVTAGSQCPAKSSGVIGVDEFCLSSDNVLYLSATSSCTAQTTTGTATKTLIISSEKKSETAKDSSSGAFVFTCDNTKCTRYISSNYLGVSGTDKYLYTCDDAGVCTSTNAITTVGYYLSGPVGTDNTYSSMIKCTDTTSSNCSDITSPPDGFYPSSVATIILIKCESGKCKDYTSSLPSSGTSYFKDASITTNIFKCNGQTSCTSIEGSKGYYINKGDNNSIIKCNGTCNVEDAKSSCGTAGQVIGVNSTIKLCITASESKEIPTSATDDSYEIITIAKDNDFPGGKKKGENIIKIGKDGSAILIEKVSLPTCKATSGSVTCFDNAGDNAFCIKDGKLYKTTVSTPTCAEESLSAVTKYFNSDYKVGALSAAGDTAAMAYECKTDECNFVKGYVSIDTSNIRCNGWTEGCEVITAGSACSANDEGSLISGKKLCFGTTEYTLPTGADEETIAFELSQTSGIYGGKKGDIIILNTSATKAVNTTLADDSGVLYFINQSKTVGGNTNAKPLIQCTNGNCVTIDSGVDANNPNTYYINGLSTSSIISCDSTGCSSVSKSAITSTEYFIDSGDNTSKSVIKCVSGGTCSSEAAIVGYYANAGVANSVIKSDNSGCSVVNVETTVTSCSKAGGLVYSSGIKICSTESDNTPSAIVNSSGSDIYKTIELAEDGDFPGGNKGKISIKISTDGYVLLLEEATLPTCTYTSSNKSCFPSSVTYVQNESKYCISNNVIYKSEVKKCTILTGTKNSSAISYYEASDYNEITPGFTTAEYIVYQCKFNSSDGKAEKCTLIKGYTTSGSDLIQCNGWKGETCSVITKATCDKDNGIIGTQGVCFSSDASKYVALPTGEDTMVIAFEVTDTNEIYGIHGGDIVVLSLKSDQAIIESLSEGQRYFINQRYSTGDKEIISCNGNQCEAIKNNIGYYLDGGYETTVTGTGNTVTTEYTKLISCTAADTACTQLPASGSALTTGYYVDASSAVEIEKEDEDGETVTATVYTNLIKCNTDNVGVKCKSYSPSLGYYINAVPDSTSAIKKALIKCTEEGCEIIDGEADSILINNDDNLLIQCYDKTSGKGCVSLATGIIGTEKIPTYFVNSDASATLETTIIKCNGTTCITMIGNVNDVFLNGNLSATGNTNGEEDKPLIICKEDGCVTENSTLSEANSSEYYINAGDYKDANNVNSSLIKCTYSTKATCTAYKANIGEGVTELFYINGNYVNDKKYLLKCTSIDDCELYGEATEAGIEHYIHGAKATAADAIIECEISDDASLRKRDNDEESSFTVECGFVDSPVAGNLYINSYNKNLIQCYGSGSVTCESFNGIIGSPTEPAYFVNASPLEGDGDLSNVLIKCTGEGTCEPIDGQENYVYINSNYYDATVTENNPNRNGDGSNKRLIICSDESCEITQISISSGINYYVNGGIVISESDPYKNALIQCEKTGACKLSRAGEDHIYINSNSDEDHPLIVCNNNVCNVEESTVEDGSDYYVNSGAYSTNKLEDSLIECTKDDGCQNKNLKTIIKDQVEEVFFKNKVYENGNDDVNYLIQCTSDGCVPFGTENPTVGISEYYINGAKSELSDSVLKVTFTNTEASKRTASPTTVKAEISLVEDAEVNDIFLNSSPNSKLIQCTSSTCETFEGTGTALAPVYYVNADGESNEEYEGLIIMCTKNACTLIKANQNDVYINGNLKGTSNGDTENPISNTKSTDESNHLIVCIDGECILKPSNLEENGSEYYIQAGHYSDGDDTYSLIKCTYSGSKATCAPDKVTIEDGVSDIYYINGNYDSDRDSVNYLIKCVSSTECTPFNNENAESGMEHYVHGSPEVLKNAVIECELKSSAARKREGSNNYVAECSLIPNAIPGNVYINTPSSLQVIKCISTGCKVEDTIPTELISQFYINEDENGDKTLIKCQKEVGCFNVEEGLEEGSKVFMNANFDPITDPDHQLIKCNEGSCDLFDSKADTDKPEYYVNGDDTNSEPLKGDLIKCEKNSEGKVRCEVNSNAVINNVYLNANYEDSKNQIIVCKKSDKVSVEEEEEEEEKSGCIEMKVEASEDKIKYYVNAGSSATDKLKDTLIQCNDSDNECILLDTVEESDIYINANTEQLIYCSTEKGCEAKETQANKDNNEFYLNANDEQPNLTNDLIKCQIDVETNEKKCIEFNGKPDFVYIDSYTKGNVIYCTSAEGCKSKPSFIEDEKGELPKFYVNGDDIDFDEGKDKDPLNGDLIKCIKTTTNNESKVICTIIKGDNYNVYINSNYNKEDGDANNQLIVCTEEEGCLAKPCSSSSTESPSVDKREELVESETTETTPSTPTEKFPKYYINSGNMNKLENGIIECTASDIACTPKTAKANEVYKNNNDHESEKPIIKCSKSGCKTAESLATEDNNEYYKNSGDGSDSSLEYDIIECSIQESGVVSCIELKEVNEGVYLNSNYVESGDNQQLIQCTKDNGCVGLRSESTSKDGEYYVNAEATSINNSVIFCVNKKCEKQTPTSLPTFYVGYMKDETDGLIQCLDKEKACEYKSSFTSSGYYLNGGYNKAQNQTILCDSSYGCSTLKVDLGYYVNAGDTSNPIIKCEKEGVECVANESPKCPESKDAIPGNYCYEDNQLKFFASTNSTGISATKSDDLYSFATIPDGGFPGIRRETGSLFKISRYFINRFYQSGVVMIDKNGKLVDNLTSDQSDVSLYDCNESTKICTEKPGCSSNTYMYDSENQKLIFCNNGKLEYAEIQGYVVDSNRAVGTNHPYIIQCENSKCKSHRPKTTSYYENSGYDAMNNALIQCSNNNCITVAAEVGYYVGHDGAGIIQCTSTTSCTFNAIKNKVKYVNAGSNKASNAIIECSKNSCSASKAKIGYYMTYSSNLLIQCTSPSSCVEFTPTVNYYDNADSSEGSNTIINCVQTSQVITCAPEATNNGFYMSSIPNVLIRCKSGSKCKTVTVKNGIFRGALKGLSGSSKRSEDDEIELEEGNDGMSVAMPRDADDAYGIIRCVAGKCSALSPSEVASIPVCEFNNNKCYITLEYAMTKSATTSISAGNICTNADRSVFYFATDTIVVKPNVISGVTATYVFTTTNSNCLEVNDSYTDMYFTVGSNIYLLDQGSVLQFYENGYYFINTSKNSLVSGNDIDAYNDENVKLYKCNGSSCSITDKPESLSYYADVNKRILKYNVNSDSYSFAYSKDIICIFANNKCTPNADLKNQEFCITYKGELVLAKQDIKNRETGECYKASSITSTIYGYSQYLYNMNIYSAQMVDETGYYIVNLSTNTTVVSKNYKTKNNNLVLYGCQLSSCKELIPDESTYYYDARAKTMLRYSNGIWSTPATSGYAYISLDPTNTYIYRFTKKLDEITINAMANYGYYYTVDGEMYHCNQDEDGDCVPISSTGYYFTNAGEVYYCIHDSEELEPTECTKQACISGQYYYIDEAYYRCESSATLVPVMSRYCSYNENVVINFPLALTEEFPDKIKQAVEGIEKNNNSTAIVSRRGKNYLESVSGIFTNCTYNVEETKSTFDLVCVNNYVALDKETDDIKICSMEQLGYVECIEDEENPEKCNISGSISHLSLSIFNMVVITLLSIIFIHRN